MNALCDYFTGKPQEGSCRRCGGTWVQHYGDANGQRGGQVAYVSEPEVPSRNGLHFTNRLPRTPICEFTGKPYTVWCVTHRRYHSDDGEDWTEACSPHPEFESPAEVEARFASLAAAQKSRDHKRISMAAAGGHVCDDCGKFLLQCQVECQVEAHFEAAQKSCDDERAMPTIVGGYTCSGCGEYLFR
jgi:hypothetical protein